MGNHAEGMCVKACKIRQAERRDLTMSKESSVFAEQMQEGKERIFKLQVLGTQRGRYTYIQ